MAYKAWQSVDLQNTSAHYQESTHIPAVITISVCFTITVLISLAVRWVDFRRKNMN